MELIEIDVICVQSPKAPFCGRDQIALLEIPRQHLGRKKHLISLTFDCLAYDFFGSICLRRVYEARTVFDCRPKRFDTSAVRKLFSIAF
jgi:hypothetical protein